MNPFTQLKQTTLLIFIVILLACFASQHRAQAQGGSSTQQQSFAAVLVGHRWEARSAGLACQGLIAIFHNGNAFEGMLQNPSNNFVIRPQMVRGKWHVAGQLLILTYNYIMNLSGPARAEFSIQITEVSERSLAGLDNRGRLWEFERLD